MFKKLLTLSLVALLTNLAGVPPSHDNSSAFEFDDSTRAEHPQTSLPLMPVGDGHNT